MSGFRACLLGFTSTAALLVAAGAAFAQPAVSAPSARPTPADPAPTSAPHTAGGAQQPTTVNEIIVTAQKRTERLQDVPISINAATGQQLKELGITNTDQLQKLVPGFTFEKTVYGQPVYYIRGIGFNDTTLGVSPAVSVYVDQQPLPFSAMARGALLDLERVEVLKGPQGTLFGENSTGGAINYIAAKPTRDPQAGFDLTYGRFNEVDAEGYVSGPLTDTVSARLAIRDEREDGWQRGYTTDETIGARDFSSGRLTLDWRPTQAVRVELTASGWRDQSESQQPQLTEYTPLLTGPTARSVPFPLASFPTAPDDSRAAAWDPGNTFRHNDYLGEIGGRLEADLSHGVTLTSLTSYAAYRQSIPVDLDGTTYSSSVSDDMGRIHSFSQELRLNGSAGDRVRWMVGTNYERDRVTETLQLDPLITSGTAVGPFTFDSTNVDNDQGIETKSVFGSLDLRLTDQLTLQGSTRYTDQDRAFAGCVADTGDGQLASALGFLSTAVTGSPQKIAPGTCGTLSSNFAPLPVVTDKLDQDNVSWRVSLNWKPNYNTLLYANVTKGYKAGSFPTLPSASATALRPISQESVLAYEAGTKVTTLGRMVQITGAGFYYDYTDKQLVGYIIDPVFGPLPSLVSIPTTSVRGGEISVVAGPFSGLTVSANGTYVDTRVDSNPTNPTGPFGTSANFVGQPFPYSPKLQGVFDVQYRFPVTPDYFSYLGASITSRSGTDASLLSGVAAVAAQEALLHIPGYTLLDLRAGVEPTAGPWRLEVFGRNVANTFYIVGATRNSDFTTRYAGLPTTYGITLHYKFGG